MPFARILGICVTSNKGLMFPFPFLSKPAVFGSSNITLVLKLTIAALDCSPSLEFHAKYLSPSRRGSRRLTPLLTQRPPPLEFWIEPLDSRVQIGFESQPNVNAVRIWNVRQHMIATEQPSREAFIAYWKDFRTFTWRQLLFYILYPGGLAVYAFVVRWIDFGRWYWLPLVGAAAYLILVP